MTEYSFQVGDIEQVFHSCDWDYFCCEGILKTAWHLFLWEEIVPLTHLCLWQGKNVLPYGSRLLYTENYVVIQHHTQMALNC